MKENTEYNYKATQPVWTRLALLIILGYEGAGALLGGALLIASPDGSYMDMPVSIMNGVFIDFMLPGIILFGLGILAAIAFIAVLRRTRRDWIMAVLALGGFFIWFVTEIIILGELHWLHAMWGLPVVLGWISAIPLIAGRNNTNSMRKTLLVWGLISSLWYVILNIIFPLLDSDYDPASMTISELSAKGAITRTLWMLFCVPYPLLLSAFGWGIIQVAEKNKALHSTGVIVLIYSLLNLYWPPMHQRAVIAAEGGTLTDVLHITWGVCTLILMMLLMVLGAKALGKRFRLFTVIIFILFIVSGVFTAIESAGMVAGRPTPCLGIWERMSIGLFMLWMAVFSIVLLRRKPSVPVADS